MSKFVISLSSALQRATAALAAAGDLSRRCTLKRAPRLILGLLVAVLCLAQSASQLVTPEIRRVGDKLACLCGACKNTVASCQMLGCHYSHPSREKIAKMQAAGVNDKAIIDSFVKEQGLRALAVPPAEGFNALAWTMPFIAIGLGLIAIWLWIKKFHPKRAAPMPELPPEVLARYQERIDQDLTKQD